MLGSDCKFRLEVYLLNLKSAYLELARPIEVLSQTF